SCTGMGIDKLDGMNDTRNLNYNCVNQGKGGSSNDLMSTCSLIDMDNGEVACDDGNHDIEIDLHDVVNKGLGVSSNDPMSSCSRADIDNGEVAGAGMRIDNFDGKNDILNDNHNAVNKGFSGYANDLMELQASCSRADMGNGESTCSLIDMDNGEVACDGMVYDFADDYMSILNDEEHEAKYSLDEMKLIDEEEKLIVKDPPVKKHVEAFIDEQEDKTIVLQENVKEIMVAKNEEKLAATAYLVSKRAWCFREQGHISFNNHDLPIVGAANSHIMGHRIQVYMENSQSFENVTIQGDVGLFFVGAYKESLILAAYLNHSLHCAG
nr:hypothetical protein [Tanacetum cinerariifolium]